MYSFEASSSSSPFFLFSFSFSVLFSPVLSLVLFLTFIGFSLHHGGYLSWSYQLVLIWSLSGDQVESRLWWVASGSSHTFVSESPDEFVRTVMGVTPQSSLLSSHLHSPLFHLLFFSPLCFYMACSVLSSAALLSLGGRTMRGV